MPSGFTIERDSDVDATIIIKHYPENLDVDEIANSLIESAKDMFAFAGSYESQGK
jgi:hypothetical protein